MQRKARRRPAAADAAAIPVTLDQPVALRPQDALAPDGMPMPAVDPDPDPLDVNGFDANEFEWRPVPRRPRGDGWTPEVQRAFIEQLADTGMVAAACRAVDMSVQSAYRLRRAAGSASFARAWDAAIAAAADRLIDIAYTRAIEGEEVPVFDRDGCRIGAKWRYNDRLLMQLLRAYRPERFGRVDDGARRVGPASARTPALPPVAEALAALTPVAPADPHRRMAPERLAHMVDGARAAAALDATEPPDHAREPYRARRVEADHPIARARREGRRASARHTPAVPDAPGDDTFRD